MAKKSVNVASLPRIELLVYAVFLACILFHFVSQLVIESSRFKNQHSVHYDSLEFNFSRDNAEFEWNNYIGRMFGDLNVLYLAFIPVLDYLLKKHLPSATKPVLIAYSLFLFQRLFTFYGVAFVLTMSVLYYTQLTVLKSRATTWTLTVAVMWLLNMTEFRRIIEPHMVKVRIDAFNEFVCCMYFMVLRMLGFCFDRIAANKDESSYNAINFTHYSLYPSFVFTSMFMPYENFKPCMSASTILSDSKAKVRALIKLVLRIAFSILIFELVLHSTLTYKIHAMHGRMLDFFSNASLTGTLLLKGALFPCKYIVFYGVTSVVNEWVGMRCGALPRCFAMMHTNGELWRFFDTGIYEFIKRYLYIPLGGNGGGVIRMAPLAASFAFISYWHGMNMNVTMWTWFNFVQVGFELFGVEYLRTSHQVALLTSKLSGATKRRLLATFLASWQCVMYINAFFFLSDMDSTVSIYGRIITSPLSFALVLTAYYCNAQFRLGLIELKI